VFKSIELKLLLTFSNHEHSSKAFHLYHMFQFRISNLFQETNLTSDMPRDESSSPKAWTRAGLDQSPGREIFRRSSLPEGWGPSGPEAPQISLLMSWMQQSSAAEFT